MMTQNEAFNALRDEIRTGFGLLIDQARLTNEKIDLTNHRVDQTNQRIDQTNQRLDQTNQKLDHSIQRLDQTIIELKDFKVEVLTKLDGIGAYLRSINGTLANHFDRLFKLEGRVDDIEKRLGA